MNSIVEMLLTGLIDPLIWIKSMSLLGNDKSKMKHFFAFLGYYLLLIGRNLLTGYLNNNAINMIMSSALIVYIFVATCVFSQGKLSEKIIGVCVFFCILFLSELITYELYETLTHVFFHTSVYTRIVYNVCGIFVKMLQAGLCYWIFKNKNIESFFEKNKETIAIVIVVASIVSSMLMINSNRKQSRSAALIFQLIEILFIWYLVCSLVEFRKKEKSIQILNNEVRGIEWRQEHVRDVDRFRHDYASNAFVMKNLWNYKEYNKLGKYMENVFPDAKRVTILFEHPNFAIQIIISNLMEIAKEMELPFLAEISVKEFQMKEEDICGMLHNLGINALKDSVQVPQSKAHVLLEVSLAKSEYRIRCVNECIVVNHAIETLELEQGNDNLEIMFVVEIVKKYHGRIECSCMKRDKKKLGQNEVRIRIPF